MCPSVNDSGLGRHVIFTILTGVWGKGQSLFTISVTVHGYKLQERQWDNRDHKTFKSTLQLKSISGNLS